MPGRETHHPDLKLPSRRRRHVDWETSGHATRDRASTRSSQLRSPESPLLTAASTTRPDIAASESPSRTVRLRKIRSASRFFSRAHPHLCVASFFRAHWRGHGAQAIMHAACWPHGDLCSRARSHLRLRHRAGRAVPHPAAAAQLHTPSPAGYRRAGAGAHACSEPHGDVLVGAALGRETVGRPVLAQAEPSHANQPAKTALDTQGCGSCVVGRLRSATPSGGRPLSQGIFKPLSAARWCNRASRRVLWASGISARQSRDWRPGADRAWGRSSPGGRSATRGSGGPGQRARLTKDRAKQCHARWLIWPAER